MPTHISDALVDEALSDARLAARSRRTRTVTVSGVPREIPVPFPSPTDWRDCWIYFLLLDRFNNPGRPPVGPWNQRFDFRQGGTFKGVQAELGYLEALGVRTLWLSPVLKNSRPDQRYNYHGYQIQDFLSLDERFASDGTPATAERELAELVDEAHARGMYVIVDIVLNHAARVFDYVWHNEVVGMFADPETMDGPLGTEPPVLWLNGFGISRPDWLDALPPPVQLSADDAVWPADLQDRLYFRRRGSKLGDEPDARGFVRGDFGDMRQLVVEYDASVPGEESRRAQYGVRPVLSILIRAYQYLIARYDLDGFRLDTVKYVEPRAIEIFGNAMREFGLSIGKHNFFTFGEVYDDEETIARFVGRNGGSGEGFGIDAALDFPLFFKLPGVAKGLVGVEAIRQVFFDRKREERELLSSHGEAGRYFVSFLDNHDQRERLGHPSTPIEQVTLALALLFTLQGIPCLYYGTEQGLQGTVAPDGRPDLTANESTREALWGKAPVAFDRDHRLFRHVQMLSQLRLAEPPLVYGRLYFREVSGNGHDFGQSSGPGGIVAFSRILVDREVLVVANTGQAPFFGYVLVDRDLHAAPGTMAVAFSNLGTEGAGTVEVVPFARFHEEGTVRAGHAMALPVILAPNEVQVLVPAGS